MDQRGYGRAAEAKPAPGGFLCRVFRVGDEILVVLIRCNYFKGAKDSKLEKGRWGWCAIARLDSVPNGRRE